MSNLEIKGQLAKLLATEDLVVEHKQVETAMFNVHTRVLTLPMWKNASNNVVDLLISHEVGHALYTPNEDWQKNLKIPHQFVNVVEDARIEKLMKRRYAGLNKTFYRGYSELHKDDFFALEGEDISKMNLADRANLYFKIGNYTKIAFDNAEEIRIIKMIDDCETFPDALAASEELYKYCKQKLEEDKDKSEEKPTSSQEGQSSSESSDDGENETVSTDSSGFDDDTEEGSDLQTDDSEVTSSGSSNQPLDEPEVKTDDRLNESLKQFVDDYVTESNYIETPDLNLDTVVNSNKKIHDHIVESYGPLLNEHPNVFTHTDSQYKKFKKSAQKEVSYLVKEFECRKSADAYARSSTSRTGVLDTSKLHTYRYNEDLFKKVTKLSDGKNHGLVFILDWSGSMSPVLEDTVKQMYNLIWFCRKVSIPFKVYAFTLEFNREVYFDGNWKMPAEHYVRKEGLFHVDERFSLMEFFTSEVSSRELDEQMLNIWRVVNSMSRHSYEYNFCPPRLGLSGTPLNESIVALHKIIPAFKKQHNLQKLNCVILTDGEAGPLCYNKEIHPHWEEKPRLCKKRIIPGNDFVRNRKTGMTYSVGPVWHQFTGILLEDLKMSLPYCNFIGIRILGRRDASYFIDSYCGCAGEKHDNAMISWRKEKSFSLDVDGYSKYFGLSSDALSEEADFEVSDEATKYQIKKAFIKSLNNKKTNKKILSEFISIVA